MPPIRHAFSVLVFCFASLVQINANADQWQVANLWQAPASRLTDTIHVQLNALGKQHQLALRPTSVLSDRLANQWPSRFPDQQPPTVWQGHLAGHTGSLVRLSVTDDDVTGWLSIDGKWLSLATTPGLANFPIDSSHDIRQTLINAFDNRQWQIKPLSVAANSDPVAARVRLDDVAPTALRIGIAVDSRFNERYRGRGLQQALTTIAGVDAVFQANLGVALVVDGIRFYSTSDSDPLVDQGGRPMKISEQFLPIRLADPELSANLAFVHLFTGHTNAIGELGHGWIDTLCRTDGYDLSVSTPFSNDVVLVAHEMIHVFGGLHVEDTTCAASTASNTMMQSRISPDTPTTLSACTLDRVRYVTDASCAAANIDIQVALAASLRQPDNRRLFTVQVTNNDQLRGAVDVLSHTTFPDGTVLTDLSPDCQIQGQRLICQHASISPAQSVEKSAWATVPAGGASSTNNQVVTTRLLHPLFVDSVTGNNRAAVDLERVDAGLEDASPFPVNASAMRAVTTGSTSYLALVLLASAWAINRIMRNGFKRVAIGRRRQHT